MDNTFSGFGPGFPALNCVDMSRWGGELTEQEARDLWAAGVRHIIVGTGDPNGAGLFAKQQAEMWLRVNGTSGGTADAYLYLWFGGDPTLQVKQGVATLAGVPVRKWWLDAEDVSPECQHMQVSDRVTFLDGCVAACRVLSLRFGIYTGGWWWNQYMPGVTKYAAFDLWNSYYDGNPDESGLPYGGWEHSAIEQYEGTTVLCGQSVDLNYAKDLEEMFTQTQFDEMFHDAMARIFPVYLKLAFEAVDGSFTDRPDIGVDFPYRPWEGEMQHCIGIGTEEVRQALLKLLGPTEAN